MSSRVARLWPGPGSGRPRVFLPDFWLKLLEAPRVGYKRLPPYAALFEVDPRMSRHDVREYLEKIYKYPVRDVRIMNQLGEVDWMWPKDLRNRRAMWKEPDKKLAYVFFKKDFIALIPDLFADEVRPDEELEKIRELSNQPNQHNTLFANRDRAGVGQLLP